MAKTIDLRKRSISGLSTGAEPFVQFLTTTGLPGGSNDMRVDGSSTPVDFFVNAEPLLDVFITKLSFAIADVNATLDKFGTIAALTNGCRLFYKRDGIEIDLDNALKTNFNFVRLAFGQPAFGSGADSFRAKNVIGNSEGFIPVVNLREFVPPFGIRLEKGTAEKIILRVRDDITAIDAFTCIAYGFKVT